MTVFLTRSVLRRPRAGRIAILLTICGALTGACTQSAQLAGGASKSDVRTNVDACRVDPATQTATADVTVTSGRSHLVVALTGKVTDQSGNVVGQGSATVGSVQPGQAYHTAISFSLDAPPTEAVSCSVTVESTA